MFPAERGQVGQNGSGYVFELAQNIDGAFQISGVPKDDGRDDEIEAGGAVLLIFVRAVADFAEPMDEDRQRETVAGFAFVELLAGPAAQIGVFDPIESEERAFQASQFAKRRSDAVLSRIGRIAGVAEGAGGGQTIEPRRERELVDRDGDQIRFGFFTTASIA